MYELQSPILMTSQAQNKLSQFGLYMSSSLNQILGDV